MTATQTLPNKTNTQKLQGKVALVTGSSRGIGAAIARKLAAEGAIIAVNYSNSKDAAEDVAASIAELGTTAKTFKANVAVENEARQLVEQVVKEFRHRNVVELRQKIGQLAMRRTVVREFVRGVHLDPIAGRQHDQFAAWKVVPQFVVGARDVPRRECQLGSQGQIGRMVIAIHDLQVHGVTYP